MTDVIAFRMRLGPVVELPAGIYLRHLMPIMSASIPARAETGER